MLLPGIHQPISHRMLPEVPSTEFQVFDGLEKMHIYLSSASFWSSSSVSIQPTLILFPQNNRACCRSTAYSFSTRDYAESLSLQHKHIKYHQCYSRVRQRFFPPVLGNTIGWSKLTEMIKGEVMSSFTLPEVIVSHRKLILSSHDAVSIQTHIRFSLDGIFPLFHVSSG